MRRVFGMLFFLILILACQRITPWLPATVTPTPSSALADTATPTLSPAPTDTATPTLSITPSPSPSATPLATTQVPAPTATALATTPTFTLQLHPDGALYVGDLVSLEVIAPPGASLEEANLTVQVNGPEGTTLGPAGFAPFGIAGRFQATLTWAWDTTMLEPGDHLLTFSIQPQEITWSQTVSLLPEGDLPPDEAQANWAMLQSDCCVFHYITGTAAERDLPQVVAQVDEEARQAAGQMGIEFNQPITITLLPRLLGHGGFASEEINVSYLDRNYAANETYMVFHHEMVHILDRRLGGDLRPSLLVEGLAVYLSGGHYKPEPLMPRAAALLAGELDLYLPLSPLADDFYSAQHEISYLQAGALIEYMLDAWGWESFSAFYRDIHPHPSGSQAQAIDVALQSHFGLTFAELEGGFIAALQDQPGAAAWREDVRLTVLHFDTLRRYQQALDPSAYFRTAWLLDSKYMRAQGILADYLRRPDAPANLALETLLIAAGDDLLAGLYTAAEAKLLAANAVLDALEGNTPDPFSAHPLAADYLAIVMALEHAGYQAQRLDVHADTALAAVSATGPELIDLSLRKIESLWVIEQHQGRALEGALPFAYFLTRQPAVSIYRN